VADNPDPPAFSFSACFQLFRKFPRRATMAAVVTERQFHRCIDPTVVRSACRHLRQVVSQFENGLG
tara:strand:- start:3991 stop:4188 length:198 start_codon:yes stop_codon:yes gene_type:complete